MSVEREILFGLLARQAHLLEERQLIDACMVWSAQPGAKLGDLLVEHGWIRPEARTRIDRLLEETLQRQSGDVRSAVNAAGLGELVQRLAALPNVEIRRAAVRLGSSDDSSTLQTVVAGAGGAATTGPDAAESAEDPLYLLHDRLVPGPRYARTSLHAAGGMGTVWLARDTYIGRDVALKELRPETASAGSVPFRFLREARITAQLEHPGVVPVYELGRDPDTGRAFYTMRFIRGHTLTEAVKTFHEHRLAGQEDPLELVTLLSAFVSVCNTIAYAHSHGIVHRDLKGENIVLGEFGEVIVLDWGLAKRLQAADEEDEAPSDASAEDLPQSAGETVMGQVMGTPAYMSPEQAQGRMDLIGPATDIFGCGAILYEMLTGGPPFHGENTVSVVQRALRVEITPPREIWPEVPPALEAACLKAMARSPEDRFGSASEFGREIQGWQDRRRRQAEGELAEAGKRLMYQQEALVALTRSGIFAGGNLQTTFRRMIQVAAQTLNVERVSVWRYTDDRRAIRCHALYELSADRYSDGVELRADAFPSYFRALDTSEVIAAHDARNDSRTCEFTETYLNPLEIGAIMDAPIHIAGSMNGVVCHEHVGGSRTWLPDEQLFAIAIANLVSQAIHLWEQRLELAELRSSGPSEDGSTGEPASGS